MNDLNCRIDSETLLYGVLGDPIKHSKSPVMLNAAFQATGHNGAYVAFHVRPDQLEEAIQGIRGLNVRGVNVTIPHKVEVMQYLDEIDEDARIIGAVNTIVNENGKLIGYNTDGIGYVRSLIEETNVKLKDANLLLIGSGGASRGVAYSLAKQAPASIWIANRTVEKASELAQDLSQFADCRALGLEDGKLISDVELPHFDLIVNTTNVGMHPNIEDVPVDLSWSGGTVTVSDLIYNPRQTKFLNLAQQRGAEVHSGFGMFIYQGAYAFEYWTGLEAPVVEMRAAVEKALSL